MRSIRRKLEAERWDPMQIGDITASPWKPYEGTDDDRILIRPPTAAVPRTMSDDVVYRSRIGEPTPRPFSIQRRDLINYGYTPSCPGCYAAANDKKYRPHTNECRRRIEEAMAADEIGDNRVKAARERENAWLEKQVREGDSSKTTSIPPAAPATPEEAPVDAQSASATPQAAPMDINDDRQDRSMDHWNERLQEDNFHEVVNEDDQMYDAIEAVPIHRNSMVNQVLAIVKNHVSEIWSPQRVNSLAAEYNLQPGFSFDIQVNDEKNEPWHFDVPAQKAECIRHILEQKPSFVIGSPMCSEFSILQGLNRNRMSKEKWDALWEKGVRPMRFALKICQLQVEGGRFFIHEHPNSASSWKLPEMMKFMDDLGIEKTVGHMCRFGMKSQDEQGIGLVKKPTGFLINSAFVRDQLERKCLGGHRHVALVGGRAKACQIYPEKLCRAMLTGIKHELVHTGVIHGEDNEMLMVSAENAQCDDYLEQYVDDISGRPLVR